MPAGADKAKLKVKVMLNLNGVVVVENAQMIEEEEVEEEVPAAPAADQPMAEAAGGEAAAEPAADAAAAAAADGAEAPMEDAAAAAPAKVIKKRTRKHPVSFASHTAALSQEQLQKLYEVEVELALQVRGVVCWLLVGQSSMGTVKQAGRRWMVTSSHSLPHSARPAGPHPE